MKNHPVVTELMHADGQTEGHDEAKGGFSKFCESTLKIFNLERAHCFQ
jgi:hypothetical protein